MRKQVRQEDEDGWGAFDTLLTAFSGVAGVVCATLIIVTIIAQVVIAISRTWR